jgi:exodeoxyribonuclease I
MKSASFYFYDLETTSGSPRTGRIMQFAGQRTDENLKPIGEPDNILVKLADDVLPEPDAILVHGITPQKTLEEGITEVELARYFDSKIAVPGTTFVGFNNIRFDDEFIRRLNYRTFYDPYQWHWKDNRSRWDMLDPIRMMRALRPEGMKWPELDGKPTVKLELMARENGLLHENAHDALSDVIALIELAQKFKQAQPKLFDYLYQNRDKKRVAELVLSDQPFVYTSGKYNSEHEKTTIVQVLFKHPRRDSAFVYDLRHDPEKWLKMPKDDLKKHWQVRYGDELEPLPVKAIQFNKCPAIAPLGVLDEKSKKRISLDMDEILKNRVKLSENKDFITKLEEMLDEIEDQQQTSLALEDSVDNKIYDGFWGDNDQVEMAQIRAADPDEISELKAQVKNKRIREMLPLYKARNYPKNLTTEEHEEWENHRRKVFYGGGESSIYFKFSKRMQEIASTRKLSKNDEYLLTELQLYAESILPEPNE